MLRCWLKPPQYPGSFGVLGALRVEFLPSRAVTGTKGIGLSWKISINRALIHELGLLGVDVEREAHFRVTYKGKDIGTYIADLVVAKEVIVELKALDGPISAPRIAQCVNYLQESHFKKY